MCRWISIYIHIPAFALPQGYDQILCSRLPHVLVSEYVFSYAYSNLLFLCTFIKTFLCVTSYI